MTITIFVEPNSLLKFLEVTKILEGLPLENDYVFNPFDLQCRETIKSDWYTIQMDISEYLKLKYCMKKLNKAAQNKG